MYDRKQPLRSRPQSSFVDAGRWDAAKDSAEKMRTLHPEFERLVMEQVMHDLYGRDGLDIKTRLLCTIAALTVLGRPQQLACSH